MKKSADVIIGHILDSMHLDVCGISATTNLSDVRCEIHKQKISKLIINGVDQTPTTPMHESMVAFLTAVIK